MLLGLDDITLIPAQMSTVRSRSECDPYYHEKRTMNGNYLPLFTAPMSSLIDTKNYNVFERCGIHTVIPRNVPVDDRISLCKYTFCAFGLREIEEKFINDTPLGFCKMSGWNDAYVCIDIANGHMEYLYQLCMKLKDRYHDRIHIMTGNVANPNTYAYICDVYNGVVDYIRLGIGGGSCCTTSANTAIHYPMATLIARCYDERASRNGEGCPKIIADGGFDSFDKIIKALALGADYVMLGSVIAKSEEACGQTYEEENLRGRRTFRDYYGMSTKKAQKELGNTELKTSEGITRKVMVEYPISKWVDNFTSYLRSAMSYMDVRSIGEFVGGVDYSSISPNAFKSFYK